jgi:RecA/RadA recombinase
VAKLRAKTPTNETVTKPKVLIFGPPGCGKTWTALEFPRVYYIDTEGGASLPHYQERLRKAGGVYLGKEDGSNDFREVIREVQSLATTPHDYLTLVIDSFSKLYNLASAQAELAVGNDYGRDRKEANKPTRQLMIWLDKLDMNVVLICHQRDKWSKVGGELQNLGVTFDGFEKLEYDLH